MTVATEAWAQIVNAAVDPEAQRLRSILNAIRPEGTDARAEVAAVLEAISAPQPFGVEGAEHLFLALRPDVERVRRSIEHVENKRALAALPRRER